jgi:hypothetical protein
MCVGRDDYSPGGSGGTKWGLLRDERVGLSAVLTVGINGSE